MNQRILHQFTEGIAVGDAISDQAFAIRTWLREAGFTSDIYATHIQAALSKEVRPAHTYQPSADERYVVYHHSIGSTVAEHLLRLPVRFVLIYHNVTPPAFVQAVDPKLARQLEYGLAQLEVLCPRTDLGLAVSPYNEADLRAAGFADTAILPIFLEERHYQTSNLPALTARLHDRHPLLLFVGRIAPNKRQEDLIKLLYYYRRIEPRATLALVGSQWLPAYVNWLKNLAQSLGLAEHLIFADHVTQAELVSYFRTADVYVSMSEHEGFGKPLIESMYLGLPVLAYATTGVPGTMGGTGVLFHEKNYEVLAEMVDMLIKDRALRARIIVRQQARAQMFLAPQVRQLWQRYLSCLA